MGIPPNFPWSDSVSFHRYLSDAAGCGKTLIHAFSGTGQYDVQPVSSQVLRKAESAENCGGDYLPGSTSPMMKILKTKQERTIARP